MVNNKAPGLMILYELGCLMNITSDVTAKTL